MSKPLNEAFKSCGIKEDETGNFICIRSDLKANCQFLMSHLLFSNLSSGRRVLFISLHETFSHNAAIALKLGMNIMKYQQLDKLRFIDVPKLLVEADRKNNDDPFSFIFSNSDEDYNLKNFFTLFKRNIDDWRSEANEPFTIIIDRINVLYSLGISTKEIESFAQKTLSYIKSPIVSKEDVINRKLLGSLFISSEISSSDDSKHLANTLSSLADQSVFIHQLKTGRCTEVDGNLGIMYSTVNGSVALNSYQYKVSEKQINLFSHGMASSVI